MAELGFDYNAEEHKPLESFDPIPAGKYSAMIVESERKQTSAGTGERLSLTWLIVEGEYEGRKVFDGINLVNPNPKAVEISMRQLSSICRALGKLRIQDSAELHDIPCEIKVGVRPSGPDAKGVHRDASNEVKDYAPLQASGTVPAPTATAAATRPASAPARQAVATAPATPARKPWERK